MIIVYSSNGQIVKTLSVNNDDDIAINVPQGMFYIEASPEKSIADYYIENRSLVEKPLKPAGFYKFNYTTKQWEPDPEQATTDVLDQRLDLLRTVVDSVNAIRWLSFTDIEKQQCIAYRQALLDIPKQSGYPLDVIWPEIPQCLK